MYSVISVVNSVPSGLRTTMQIAEHIFSTHIQEDQSTFGAMHPGGTQIYFVGDPKDRMVIVDSGEPYRSWTKQILDYHAEFGRPQISAILITHGHGDHIGGLDRLQEAMGCPVRCHPKLAPYLAQRLEPGCVQKLQSRETISIGGGTSLRVLFTPGHADDHVAYFLSAGRVIFSGDTILGSSSTSVRNLRQYMASLELLASQRPSIICPGHGQIIHDATSRIRWYIPAPAKTGRAGGGGTGGGRPHGERSSARRLSAEPAPKSKASRGQQRAHPPGETGRGRPGQRRFSYLRVEY